MIEGRVTSGQDIPRRLRETPAKVQSGVDKTVRTLALKLASMVQGKLTGQVLNVRTGRLRGSITHKVQSNGQSITGVVGTNVVYAKTHELGLTIPAHIVEAKNAKALRFVMGGKVMFRKRVKIPAVKMPKRSFLLSSLKDMEPEIRQKLQDVVIRGLDY